MNFKKRLVVPTEEPDSQDPPFSVADVASTDSATLQKKLAVQKEAYLPHHVVLEVLQRGYRRGDHLFRPAKVIVNDLRHFPDGHHAG